MSSSLTIYGNMHFVLGGLFMAFYILNWHLKSAVTDQNKYILLGWFIANSAVVVRIGWWVIALIMANNELVGYKLNGDPIFAIYHEWFVSHKHWMTVPTGFLFVLGQVIFVDHIQNMSRAKKGALIIGAGILALMATYIGF